jgi:hypothetical protein
MNESSIENSLSEIQASSSLDLEDLIIFSLLDEFGLQFMSKPCFQWLSQCVSQQLNAG